MAMAAMEGAMVFQKGLGAVHALSHPTGGLKGYRLHHGTLNAVYLPAVLRFNEPAVGEKYRKVAQGMGLPASEANVPCPFRVLTTARATPRQWKSRSAAARRMAGRSSPEIQNSSSRRPKPAILSLMPLARSACQ